jgi:hypothetical protein
MAGAMRVPAWQRFLRKATGGGILYNCREIAKYPTKGLEVTKSLAPGIGGGAIS